MEAIAKLILILVIGPGVAAIVAMLYEMAIGVTVNKQNNSDSGLTVFWVSWGVIALMVI